MTIEQRNVRIQAQVVLAGIILLGLKFLAYFLTASNTVLTDALESVINVVAGGLGIYSLWLAAHPKDENHPYGHGKVEFISAGVEGTLIALAGLTIIFKSVYALFYPQALQKLDIGIAITAFAGLVNYGMGHYLTQRAKAMRSLTLEASGEHLKSDAYSTVGLVIGLGLIWFTDYVWLDSLVALIFGGIIGFTGYRLVKSSVAGIMDETDYALINQVVEALQTHRQPNWIDVHNLRIIKYGASLHIDCHLTLPWYFDARQTHEEIEALEALLRREIPGAGELFVHVDPCVLESCQLCSLLDCPKRQAPFQGLETWTQTNIMRNKKHGKL